MRLKLNISYRMNGNISYLLVLVQHLDYLYTVITVPNVAAIISQALNPGEQRKIEQTLGAREAFALEFVFTSSIIMKNATQ